MKYGKKGMISKSDINRIFGLNYEGNIEFKVGDKKYECVNISQLIKDLTIGNIVRFQMISENLHGVDFRIYSKNEDENGVITFEIQIINDYLNKNKIITLLKGREIENKELAKRIGNLIDTELAKFLEAFSKKMYKDGVADEGRTPSRIKLATELYACADKLKQSSEILKK